MDDLDVMELAIAVLGLPEDSEYEYIDETLYKRFECSLDTFSKIAGSLIPFTIPAQAGITGKVYQGFVKDNTFIVKKKFN